jgi:hypothetical protein
MRLDLGGAKVGLSWRTVVVRGARVSLSQAAASALDTAFGVTALTEGQPLGVVDVRGAVE